MGSAGGSAMHQDRHEDGAYRRIELITGVARRRRWTAAEKAALVAESLQPGVNISALARRHGVNRGLLQTWRRNAMRPVADHGGSFVPVRVEDALAADAGAPGPEQRAAAPACPDSVIQGGAIEIESGALRVRFSGPVDAGALRIVLAHLGRRA
jgi:transposase